MTINVQQMGGNGSFDKSLGRIRGNERTHQELNERIGGHKILLQIKNQKQVKLPVNSNSASPIYLGGRKNGQDSVEVTTIGIYEKHKCVGQIDLKFDKHGDLIPYSKDDKGSSHFHHFQENPNTGEVGRKSHDKTNTHPIDSKFDDLIHKIVEYNKKHRR